MNNELMVLDVQRVRAERVKDSVESWRNNPNIISVNVKPLFGRIFVVITAKTLLNQVYFRRDNLTLSLEEVEKAKIFKISFRGMIDEVEWIMLDEGKKFYSSCQLIAGGKEQERKILAEGTLDFCLKCARELEKLFAETKENEHRAEIEKLLAEAESLTTFGKAEEKHIRELLDRARRLADWADLDFEMGVRQEAFRISSSIRVGDSVLGGVQLKFKVK